MNRIIRKIQDWMSSNKEYFTKLGLKAPATVDVFMGQPEKPEQFEFEIPALFIDYQLDYASERGYLYIHALYDMDADSENYEQTPEEGMQYIQYCKQIKRILRGRKTVNSAGPLLLYLDTPMTANNFHYHRLDFEFAIYNDLDEDLGEVYSLVGDLDVDIDKGKQKRTAPII